MAVFELKNPEDAPVCIYSGLRGGFSDKRLLKNSIGKAQTKSTRSRIINTVTKSMKSATQPSEEFQRSLQFCCGEGDDLPPTGTGDVLDDESSRCSKERKRR